MSEVFTKVYATCIWARGKATKQEALEPVFYSHAVLHEETRLEILLYMHPSQARELFRLRSYTDTFRSLEKGVYSRSAAMC